MYNLSATGPATLSYHIQNWQIVISLICTCLLTSSCVWMVASPPRMYPRWLWSLNWCPSRWHLTFNPWWKGTKNFEGAKNGDGREWDISSSTGKELNGSERVRVEERMDSKSLMSRNRTLMFKWWARGLQEFFDIMIRPPQGRGPSPLSSVPCPLSGDGPRRHYRVWQNLAWN